jgi:RNA polymerase sigma-70 factor, ECF subfamily
VPATPVSLLDRLRRQPAAADWRRLVEVYEPFIRHWLRDPALRNDREDLIQDVLAVLVRELPRFERRRAGSFRAWLRTVTVNRVSQWWRQRQARPAAAGGTDAAYGLAQLEDPHSALSRQWDVEHDRHVAQRLLDLLEPEFSAHSWKAFRRQAVDGVPAADVAAELSTTVNAVLVAKSKVLSRLREEAQGLID